VIVTNMSDATATLVDAATQQVVATLPTGAGPHEVATSANGRWAVATNYGNREGAGSTLTVIDVRARTVSRTIDLSPHRRPHSATFLPGDSLLAVTKFAAALQAAQGADKPALIRIETRAGHGAGTPTTKLIDAASDMYAFLVSVLGVPVN
jgi:YVTN family beta-propeller protein